MPIYFSRNGVTIALKDPTWPEGVEEHPRQTIGYSDGGRIQVSIDGDPDVVIPLTFVRVPGDQFFALRNFIGNQTSWGGYTFQYQDWNHVTLNNVRYIEGIATFKRRRGGKYYGTLTLKKDLGI